MMRIERKARRAALAAGLAIATGAAFAQGSGALATQSSERASDAANIEKSTIGGPSGAGHGNVPMPRVKRETRPSDRAAASAREPDARGASTSTDDVRSSEPGKNSADEATSQPSSRGGGNQAASGQG